MKKRPTEMVYCPYCERKVRPVYSVVKEGIVSQFFQGIFKAFFFIFTCGLGYILYRCAKAFCHNPQECPICGAILKEGNYDYDN